MERKLIAGQSLGSTAMYGPKVEFTVRRSKVT